MANTETQKIEAYLELINAKQKKQNRNRLILFGGGGISVVIALITAFYMGVFEAQESIEPQGQPFEQAIDKSLIAQEDTAIFFASRSVANEEYVTEPEEALIVSDRMPRFPGGDHAMYEFIKENIQFPEEAKNNGVEGRVYLRFIVEADGRITNIEVIRGEGFGCDEEAIRILKAMPSWEPGVMQGEYVPVFSSLAVDFRFL